MVESSMNDKKVYSAIAAVTLEMSKIGITKDRRNVQQGYSFRGIDDVYNALAPILSKNGLVILPAVTKREVTERATAKGGVLFYVVVDMTFTLVSAVDGSSCTVSTVGEAMDSGDKATNKAMSAAYKYMCMQTFCIPTEGDNDADATTHTVEAAPKPADPVDLTEQRLLMSTCTSLEEFQRVWSAFPVGVKRLLEADKNQRKAELSGKVVKQPSDEDVARDFARQEEVKVPF